MLTGHQIKKLSEIVTAIKSQEFILRSGHYFDVRDEDENGEWLEDRIINKCEGCSLGLMADRIGLADEFINNNSELISALLGDKRNIEGQFYEHYGMSQQDLESIQLLNDKAIDMVRTSFVTDYLELAIAEGEFYYSIELESWATHDISSGIHMVHKVSGEKKLFSYKPITLGNTTVNEETKGDEANV